MGADGRMRPAKASCAMSTSAGPQRDARLGNATDGQPPSAGADPAAAPPRAAFLRSFVYAWSGVRYMFRTQRNARVHLAFAVGAIALGLALRISPLEFAVLALMIVVVLVAEMTNTVVEAVVDLVTRAYHPLAQIAKDVAAGAVLLAAIAAVIVGLLILGPHLWAYAQPLLGR